MLPSLHTAFRQSGPDLNRLSVGGPPTTPSSQESARRRTQAPDNRPCHFLYFLCCQMCAAPHRVFYFLGRSLQPILEPVGSLFSLSFISSSSPPSRTA